MSEQQPERDELETQLRNFYTLLGGARDAPDRTSLVSQTYFAHARISARAIYLRAKNTSGSRD